MGRLEVNFVNHAIPMSGTKTLIKLELTSVVEMKDSNLL